MIFGDIFMKKQEKIQNINNYAIKSLKRHHVVYETENGKKFKFLKILYFITAAVSFFMVFSFIFGDFLYYAGAKNDSQEMLKRFVPTAVLFGVTLLALVIGIVLAALKKHILAGVLSVASLGVQLIALVPQLKNVHLSRAGLNQVYWGRHFLPSVLCILAISVCVYIILKAKYIEDRAYKNLVDTLYSQNKDAQDMTEEEWTAFLKKYDPRKVEEERRMAKKGIKYESIITEDTTE